MRDPLVDALRTALAEGLGRDAELRRAYADLRETCAFAVDPRHADRDLARLIARYKRWETPVGARFEAVLDRLPSLPSWNEAGVRGGQAFSAGRPSPTTARNLTTGGSSEDPRPSFGRLVREGVASLLAEHLGLGLDRVRVLDPWAGDGALLSMLAGAAGHGNVADPAAYASAVERVGERICLADSFRLPERDPTPGFSFSDDENTERITLQQSVDFEVVVSDLRNATAPDARARRRVRETYGEGLAAVRWMSDRLASRGIVAFLSDGAFIDEPSMAGMRSALEREFGRIDHVVLGESRGLTFLVRGGRRGPIRYGHAAASFGEVEWRELEPTPAHVWRTEILAPEWPGFLPLVGERGAIFASENAGAPDGRDAPGPGAKGARRVMRQPYAAAWRALDRNARREPWPGDEPTLVVLREPFGVFSSNAPVDRRFGRTSVRTVSGAVSASALRRFRTVYGAGVVDRDVFDYVLALLHHPAYGRRYREDLRRGAPRIPLIEPERLEVLARVDGGPSAGPGTAFGTGWLDPDDFEPGSVPDYDDPFASPYARGDVEPGFLLFCGLGAALYRVQTGFERLLPYPLERIESSDFDGRVERMRLSGDTARLVLSPSLTLAGIPPEASSAKIGTRTALEWTVEAQRVRRDFDPNRPDDPEHLVRLVGKVVAASVETARLQGLVGTVDLDRFV